MIIRERNQPEASISAKQTEALGKTTIGSFKKLLIQGT